VIVAVVVMSVCVVLLAVRPLWVLLPLAIGAELLLLYLILRGFLWIVGRIGGAAYASAWNEQRSPGASRPAPAPRVAGAALVLQVFVAIVDAFFVD